MPRSARPNQLPATIEPMLAESADEPFDSDQHLFEVKWDGIRCIAFVEAGGIRLQGRRDAQIAERYPELADLGRLPPGTVVDAEIVALEGGKPSFARLAQRMHVSDAARIEMLRSHVPATLMTFDLLYLRGENAMAWPLQRRREQLRKLVADLDSPHVLVSDFVRGAGRQYFEACRKFGLEGIIGKRLDSVYRPGKRSRDWLIVRVEQVGVFDIIGFLPDAKCPDAISALILGEAVGRRWSYKGRVGSGFSEPQRRELHALLSASKPLQRPPANGPPGAVWRAAGKRCRVRFFEKTAVGMLRGPVFEQLED